MKTPADTHRLAVSPKAGHGPIEPRYPPAACRGPSGSLRALRRLHWPLGLILLPLALFGQATFTQVTEGPHVADQGNYGMGGWSDYDNDGYADLLVEHYALGSDAIYRNNRDGTFSRFPEPPGLAGAYLANSLCADFDNNGNQDLYARVGTDAYIGYGNGQGDFSRKFLTGRRFGWAAHADYDRDSLIDSYWNWWAGGNSLHHNQGNREFLSYADTGDEGPADIHSYGGPCWGDFDDDGWPDLYVPSLRDSRSYMFRNEANGRFATVTNLITQTTAAAFQAAWGDYDNDDRLDLFVACYNGTSALYHNLGNGQFERPADAPTLTGTHNFVAWVDYDNDGFLDLWVSGYMSGNKLFRNNGDGSFTEVTTEPIVTERPMNNAGTYQVAWFDYDNDGFLDAYVMNGDDTGSIWTVNQLFHNNGNGNAWLTVRPIATVSNRDGIGAKVRVLATYTGSTRWQRRDISGGCTSNGNHRYAHFGLGDATNVTTLRIEWPSGIVQELKDVTPNQILTVTEPPRLVPLGLGAFQIQCWVNQTFDVEASTDLATWSKVDTVTNQATSTFVYTDAAATGYESRYYRVLAK